MHYYSTLQCVKSVCIQSYSGPYFPAFGLNMERYGVSLCIQSECKKIQTRITPNTNTSCSAIFGNYHVISHDNSWKLSHLIDVILLAVLRGWDRGSHGPRPHSFSSKKGLHPKKKKVEKKICLQRLDLFLSKKRNRKERNHCVSAIRNFNDIIAKHVNALCI